MKKRVLHVIDSLDLGGAQTFLLGLCTNLDRDLFECEVACMHGRGMYAAPLEAEGIKVHSLSPGKFPPLYLPNFGKLMHTGAYDILHFHLFGANLCAKPLAILAGHPAIVVHDQCNDASRDRNPLLLLADAFWNRFAHHIVAVSTSTARYLEEREDLADDRLHVIPNGVDADLFRPPTAQEKLLAKKSLGFPENSVVVGGVGRLVEQKNFPLFLRIASTIVRTHPDVVFTVAGTGPLEKHLRSMAADLGISEKVRFLGLVSDRMRIYQAFDVFLMTSLYEGTPMALLEAMASALPVVASATDGIAEVCTDGMNASLLTDHNVQGYARALLPFLADASLRSRFGRAARESIIADYGIASLAGRIAKIYEELVPCRLSA